MPDVANDNGSPAWQDELAAQVLADDATNGNDADGGDDGGDGGGDA